ncbi:MAG: hypothetical protein CM15mP95_2800 [Alphaproteobacteria bacterium]|nr:MAG: hypothetical protein CM15mP95_2800 [Alphaproteobacteria bacterium]
MTRVPNKASNQPLIKLPRTVPRWSLHTGYQLLLMPMKLLFWNGGEIKERGTHTHLLTQNGLYADMWTRQLEKSDAELKLQALNDEVTETKLTH